MIARRPAGAEQGHGSVAAARPNVPGSSRTPRPVIPAHAALENFGNTSSIVIIGR